MINKKRNRVNQKEIVSCSEKETQKLARDLFKEFAKDRKGALIFLLKGDLGSGKTTFLKGLERILKVKIVSPTFIIYRRYPISVLGFKNFYHFDFYRLSKKTEIQELLPKEILSLPENFIAIEWPKKISYQNIGSFIEITFENLDEKRRKIKIKSKIK